jgi:hypothetical protein
MAAGRQAEGMPFGSALQLSNRPGHGNEDSVDSAPYAGLHASSSETSSNKEESDEGKILDRERLAKAVEITVMAGGSRRRLDSIHGVEPRSRSRFLAMGSDAEDSEESVEEGTPTSQALIQEALQAGFTIDQIRLAEEDLTSPTTSSLKVRNSSKLSLSSQIVDVWMENRRKKVQPWKDPLPKPRKSQLRTFGDALALATRDSSASGKKSAMTVHDRDQSPAPNRGTGRSTFFAWT